MTAPRWFVFPALIALCFFGGVVPSALRAQDVPCTEEIRAFCADVQPGGGRIMQCLKNNEAKLSMACAGRLHALQETMAGPLGACRDDWVAYCYHPHVSTGRDAMLQCLQANQSKVTAACLKVLQRAGGTGRQPRGNTTP